MTVTRDDSQFICASIASLEEHLVFGSLLASLVVMVFIRNIRAVIIASLAIPGVDHRDIHADARRWASR